MIHLHMNDHMDDMEHHNRAIESLSRRVPTLGSLDVILDAIAEEFAMPFCPAPELRAKLESYRPGSSAGKSAQELYEIGSSLGAPGSVHNAGWLVDFIWQCVPDIDEKMLAAAMRAHWHGGKIDFSFLPDSRITDPDEYNHAAQEIIELLRGDWTDWQPRDLLANTEYDHDLDFYGSLRNRFTVYRGVPDIDAELAALGICWTTERDIAEWFALRGASDPTVLSARITKDQIATVFDRECEVVLQPHEWRLLKCRRTSLKPRPVFVWHSRQAA